MCISLLRCIFAPRTKLLQLLRFVLRLLFLAYVCTRSLSASRSRNAAIDGTLLPWYWIQQFCRSVIVSYLTVAWDLGDLETLGVVLATSQRDSEVVLNWFFTFTVVLWILWCAFVACLACGVGSVHLTCSVRSRSFKLEAPQRQITQDDTRPGSGLIPKAYLFKIYLGIYFCYSSTQTR